MVEVLDPATQALLARTESYVAREVAGPFLFPSTGTVILRLTERPSGQISKCGIPYRLEALPVP